MRHKTEHWSTRWFTGVLVFAIANAAIFLAEWTEPSVPTYSLMQWIVGGAINLLVRTAVFQPLMYAVPADLNRSVGLRVAATLNAGLEAMHWLWAVQIFVLSTITPTVLVMALSFLMLSITASRYWASKKIVGLAYAASLWSSLLIAMAGQNQLTLAVICGLSVCAIAIYAMSIFPLPATRPRGGKINSGSAEAHEKAIQAVRNDAAVALEKRSSFFAGASHDFKQRLHALKLMAHSTTADLPVDDKNRKALTRISAEVAELEGYLGEILDFARIEAADMPIRIAPVSLQKLMQKADLNFEAVAAAKRIPLTFRTTTLNVMADPVLLQRMLENLVSNALKFTRGRVLVAARKRGTFVHLEVWDQGPGIAPESQAKIFDAFHQDASAATGESKGVGLGLAVVQRLAVELGCSVAVRSVQDKGSVFTLSIKATAASQA